MKRKIEQILIDIVDFVIIVSLFGPSKAGRITGQDVVTSSQLVKAVDISQLSTAEFVYNGIAEKYKEGNPEEVECYISYNASVKVGVQMEDIKFDIDKDSKTVTPVLPEIDVNITDLDEGSISYIPEDPDIPLKEIIRCCEDDAVREASESDELYQTAEENLRSVIEALLKPVLTDAGYEIVWEAE